MCKQVGAVITWKNAPLLFQNRYGLLKGEHYKSGNTGVLHLGYSSIGFHTRNQYFEWVIIQVNYKRLLEIVWAYCDVIVWELCEVIIVMSLWGQCDFQFGLPVGSYCDLSMRFEWDHLDVMVTSNCGLVNGRFSSVEKKKIQRVKTERKNLKSCT